jgi:hypothetical protein
MDRRRSVQEDLNVKNSYLIFLAYFESFWLFDLLLFSVLHRLAVFSFLPNTGFKFVSFCFEQFYTFWR